MSDRDSRDSARKERDSNRNRQTDKNTGRQTDRQTQIDRDRDLQTETETTGALTFSSGVRGWREGRVDGCLTKDDICTTQRKTDLAQK